MNINNNGGIKPNNSGNLNLNRGGSSTPSNNASQGNTGVISLQKGERVSLSKNNPSLDKVLVGLGWDVNNYQGPDFDLDAQAFMLSENGKVRSNADFIFYNQLKSPCGSVEHTGDNRTGEGDGDDESVIVTLSKVPQDVQKIVFSVTIHDAIQKNQKFGQVSNAFIRLVDQTTGSEIIRYDLSEEYSVETSLVVAELYRHNGEWKFNAVGAGYQTDLAGFCNRYGVGIG